MRAQVGVRDLKGRVSLPKHFSVLITSSYSNCNYAFLKFINNVSVILVFKKNNITCSSGFEMVKHW